MRPRGHSAGEKETAALAAAMWSAAPDRQRDYCSLFVLTTCQEQRASVIGKRRRYGAPPSDRLQAGLLPRRQWAVRESASTAGSVVTEVSVGLAFSSSHSIGSGLRLRARARTPSVPQPRT